MSTWCGPLDTNVTLKKFFVSYARTIGRLLLTPMETVLLSECFVWFVYLG